MSWHQQGRAAVHGGPHEGYDRHEKTICPELCQAEVTSCKR